MDDWRTEARVGFSVYRPTSVALVTGLSDGKRAFVEALAKLEEEHPDEAALLREISDCGRSTDPRWR